MTIIVRTKADLDAKNIVCQRLSQYRKRLKSFECILAPYAALFESQQIIKVRSDFFTIVKELCDALNDSIDNVKNVLKTPGLSRTEEQKRRTLPWYDSMSAWAHDSRAFIQNIYPIVRGYTGCCVHSPDMHSLIALQSALVSMAQIFWSDLTERKVDEGIADCEIYKLFDKFQKCYREKGKAFWRSPDSGCRASVFCAKGFAAVPLNLYANAFKYLPSQRPIDHSIEVSFFEDENGVRIIVSSIGPLVSQEDIPKLWTPGFRSPSANLATDEGYGLGLPTVKRLCDVSGFSANITSEHRSCDDEGWGLFTVSITVPISACVDCRPNDVLHEPIGIR